ncbi:MAG: N-acetylneuraminic acid mutarotase, partial [Myxococcota bacterium]
GMATPDSGTADSGSDEPELPDASELDVGPNVPVPTFEPPIATWESRAPMPVGRRGAGAATHGSNAYIVGGVQATAAAIYSVTNDTWALGADMPQARYWAGVGSINGPVYVVGGRVAQTDGHQSLGTTIRYNPADDSWKQSISAPDAGCCGAAVVVADRLYLTGGRNGSALVHSLDPAQGVWLHHANMPLGRSRHAAAALDTAIVVVGGLTGDDDGTHVTGVAIYETTTDEWTEAPEAPFERTDLAVAAHQGLIWVLGGRDTVGEATAEVWALDPGIGWGAAVPMPFARADHTALSADQAVLVLGGEDPSGALPLAVDAMIL